MLARVDDQILERIRSKDMSGHAIKVATPGASHCRSRWDVQFGACVAAAATGLHMDVALLFDLERGRPHGDGEVLVRVDIEREDEAMLGLRILSVRCIGTFFAGHRLTRASRALY